MTAIFGGQGADKRRPPPRRETMLGVECTKTTKARVHQPEFVLAYDHQHELWLVNTRFCCLCTLDAEHSFAPRWRPPFVSALAPEDRCHLNGLCMVDGRPKYVTALAETDTAGGWRAQKARGGLLMDVETNEILLR